MNMDPHAEFYVAGTILAVEDHGMDDPASYPLPTATDLWTPNAADFALALDAQKRVPGSPGFSLEGPGRQIFSNLRCCDNLAFATAEFLNGFVTQTHGTRLTRNLLRKKLQLCNNQLASNTLRRISSTIKAIRLAVLAKDHGPKAAANVLLREAYQCCWKNSSASALHERGFTFRAVADETTKRQLLEAARLVEATTISGEHVYRKNFTKTYAVNLLRATIERPTSFGPPPDTSRGDPLSHFAFGGWRRFEELVDAERATTLFVNDLVGCFTCLTTPYSVNNAVYFATFYRDNLLAADIGHSTRILSFDADVIDEFVTSAFNAVDSHSKSYYGHDYERRTVFLKRALPITVAYTLSPRTFAYHSKTTEKAKAGLFRFLQREQDADLRQAAKAFAGCFKLEV